MVREFMRYGTDANVTYAFIYAYSEGHIEVVRLLIEMNDGACPLSYNGGLLSAIGQGNIKMLKLMLENGADVNFEDHMGSKPLHDAAYEGNIEIVRTLLKNGAIPNVLNNSCTSISRWKKQRYFLCT